MPTRKNPYHNTSNFRSVIFIFGNNFTKYDLGDRIANRRKACGFKSQTSLAMCMVPQNDNGDDYAKQVESKRKAISNWESGKADPPLSEFTSLCKLLDCDAQYLLGEIDTPRIETKTVMDITGLSEKSVDMLLHIKRGNKMTWWGDTLNLIVEDANFIDLLHTVTDYIDDQGEDAQIINGNIAATSTPKYKTSDILQYKVQNLLFSILRDIKGSFDSREDKRVFYSLVYTWQKDGKIGQSQAEKSIEKLDNGDFSDFLIGGKYNG